MTPQATAPPLPDLQLRGYRAGDAQPLSELLNRSNAANGGNWRTDAAELENYFSEATDKFDPMRDQLMVDAAGRLVAGGEVEWVDTTDGLREYRCNAAVDPDWRRRGIGRWLHRLLEAHARQLDRLYPTDRQRFYGAWTEEKALGARVLLEREGYKPARWFIEMARPDMDQIGEPSLPPGLEFRPVHTEHLRQLWEADVEAFQDHWGGFDGSEARFRQWTTDPKFDPSLFVVAWDGDEVAGAVINEINEVENEAFNRRRGWLSSVFVRRAWRRRGLGEALVLRSLQVFRERGMTSAGLGADADNPTGAVGLYERTGFVVETRAIAFRKPM